MGTRLGSIRARSAPHRASALLALPHPGRVAGSGSRGPPRASPMPGAVSSLDLVAPPLDRSPDRSGGPSTMALTCRDQWRGCGRRCSGGGPVQRERALGVDHDHTPVEAGGGDDEAAAAGALSHRDHRCRRAGRRPRTRRTSTPGGDLREGRSRGRRRLPKSGYTSSTPVPKQRPHARCCFQHAQRCRGTWRLAQVLRLHRSGSSVPRERAGSTSVQGFRPDDP